MYKKVSKIIHVKVTQWQAQKITSENIGQDHKSLINLFSAIKQVDIVIDFHFKIYLI